MTHAVGQGVGEYEGHIYNRTEIDMRKRYTYDSERIGPHRKA